MPFGRSGLERTRRTVLQSFGIDNPAMSGAGLGKVICDTYMYGCKENASSEMATLSVTDISKVPELERAYGAFAV